MIYSQLYALCEDLKKAFTELLRLLRVSQIKLSNASFQICGTRNFEISYKNINFRYFGSLFGDNLSLVESRYVELKGNRKSLLDIIKGLVKLNL